MINDENRELKDIKIYVHSTCIAPVIQIMTGGFQKEKIYAVWSKDRTFIIFFQFTFFLFSFISYLNFDNVASQNGKQIRNWSFFSLFKDVFVPYFSK